MKTIRQNSIHPIILDERVGGGVGVGGYWGGNGGRGEGGGGKKFAMK